MRYSAKCIVITSALYICTSGAYVFSEDTRTRNDVDQVSFFSASTNRNSSKLAAHLYVTTPSNNCIIVKADGNDHKHSYKINDIECKVQKGAFHIILPHKYFSTYYIIQYLFRGKEKNPRALIFKERYGKVLFTIEIPDQNSHITQAFGKNAVLPYHLERSNIIEQYIRFKERGHLHVKKQLGEAAANMLNAW